MNSMKMIMESWRSYQLIAEGNLNYSQTAFNEIKKFVVENQDQNKSVHKFINFPLKEILNLNSKNIKNGAILFLLFHVMHLKDVSLDEIARDWNSKEKSFNLFNNLLESDIDLLVIVNHMTGANGRAGFLKLKSGDWQLYVMIDPRSDNLGEIIIHELQHITQEANGLSLSYGLQLDKCDGDFSKIKILDIKNDRDQIAPYGTPKTLTNLRQDSDGDREKNYYGDDYEYETWTTALAGDFVDFMINQKSFDKKIILKSLVAEKNKFSPQILQNIKKSHPDLFSSYLKMMDENKPIHSINSISVDFVRLLKNDSLIQNDFFAVDDRHQKFINHNNKLRPKEFWGDMVTKIEIKLREIAATLLKK